jgi:hypothetical protein
MENAKFELIPSFLEHYQYYPMKKGLLLLLLVSLWSIPAVWANFSLQKLQVNYQTQPLGTDLGTPQFSWQMKASSIKGLAQVAYQIKVVDEKNQRFGNLQKSILMFSCYPIRRKTLTSSYQIHVVFDSLG